MMSKILLLNFLVLLFPFLGTAQNNDATFNIADNISGFNYSVNSIVVQPDGKVLVVGGFTTFSESTLNKIVRLNTDGTLDNSFTIGTGFNNDVFAIALQSDGKILVGGWFTSFNESPANYMVRLNTDGTLDNSFTTGTGFDGSVWSIVLQSDGIILVGGNFTDYNGSSVNKIARLNTDGTLDNSFTIGTGFNYPVQTIVLQSDGKIIVGGNFIDFNGIPVNHIVRLNSDGTLDNSLTVGTGFNTIVNSIVLQADGKILVGGQFTSFNGSPSNRIARLNTDGTLDNSFTIGTGFNSSVLSIAVQSDGKALVGGQFSSFNSSSTDRIARLNTDGTLDNSFTVGRGFNNQVRSVVVQSDGKILVGGEFTGFNGSPVNCFARLKSDGTLDNSFMIGTGFNRIVESIAVQADGKILVGGDFTSYNGSSTDRIARLNSDGTLDNSFTTGTGFDNYVWSVALQSDGKILVVGNFTNFNGSTVNKIARLNSDGTIDNSFIIGTGFNNTPISIALQSDGKIIVGGNFYSYDGSTVKNIARLNSDGTLDNSFTIGTGFNYSVYSIAVQSDGKILLGGEFTSYNGSTVNNIARLNTDGTLDNSFTTGTGFNSRVHSIVPQPDGKILVGGNFTDFNGSTVNKIARLNSDGALDNSFTTGTGFNNIVYSIALQADGKILVGGFFTGFNGVVRNRIARLTNCIASTFVFTHSSCGPYTWINGVNYTASNNSAFHTIVGGAISGCDSIVTLNLTITAINTAVTQANDVLTSQETGATYQWIDCSDNSPIAGETNASFTATANGSYAVKVTKNSCTETSTCYNVSTVGVENLSATSYKLYPNPVTDVLTIESQENVQQVELYSITGQLLQTITPQSNVVELDVAPYGAGVYIVKIQNKNGNSSTNRVVKK